MTVLVVVDWPDFGRSLDLEEIITWGWLVDIFDVSRLSMVLFIRSRYRSSFCPLGGGLVAENEVVVVAVVLFLAGGGWWRTCSGEP